MGFFYTKAMSMLEKIFKKKEFTPGIAGIRNLFTTKIFGRTNENTDLYKGWVYRCVSTIAEEVSSSKLRLYKRGKNGKNDEEVLDHELLRLLERPNPEMTLADVLEWISSFIDLDGNAYLYKAKVANKTKELWPLRSDWVKVKPSDDKKRLVGGYAYFNGEGNIPLDIEEVIHFREFNPKFFNKQTPFKGIGTVEAAKDIVEEDHTIKEWNKKFFENGAVTSGVLEYDGELNEKQKKRIELGWKKQQEGTENAGRTPILSGGLKWKQTQFSQRELAFIDQRKLDRDDIFLMFGIPKGLLMAEDVNLANSKTALWAFTRFTVRPRLRKIEDVLNATLAKEYGDEFYFEFDNPVPEDRAQTVSEYSAGVNQWLTPNDIRREEGLEELEGGDELRQSTSNPLLGLGVHDHEHKGKKKSLNTDERTVKGEGAWNDMLKAQQPYEDKYKGEFRKYFHGLRTRVIQRLSEQKAVKAQTSDLIDDDEEVSAMVDLLTPMQRELLEKSGKLALKKLGLTNDFVITPTIEEVLSKYNIRLATAINRTTRQQLEDIFVEGEGDGIQEVTSKIDQYFEWADDTRAERIARSETIRTSNQGMEDAWAQSEIVESKEWYTALDERVCPFCDEMDGTVVALGENYFDKGDEFNGMTLDFRDIGEPPLHTSCRCVLLPVLK